MGCHLEILHKILHTLTNRRQNYYQIDFSVKETQIRTDCSEYIQL